MVGQKEIQRKAGEQTRRVRRFAGQSGAEQQREQDQVGEQRQQIAALGAGQLPDHAPWCPRPPVAPRQVAMQGEGEDGTALLR